MQAGFDSVLCLAETPGVMQPLKAAVQNHRSIYLWLTLKAILQEAAVGLMTLVV